MTTKDEPMPHPARSLLISAAAFALVAGCSRPIDVDMRGLGNGFDTSGAVQDLPSRPQPDARGVMSYPNYQVVAAREGDTARAVAQRLGLDADGLARYNGIEPDSPLREGEILALPTRVTEPAAPQAAAPTQPLPSAAGSRIDVTSLASAAIDRAGPTPVQPQAAAPAPAPTPAPVTPGSTSSASSSAASAPGPEPLRHQVQRGETVYAIARQYGVPVRTIAEWNGLGPDLAIREGQYLLLPQSASPAPQPVQEMPVTEPGEGSPTPTPPSASAPLPEDEAPAAAPAAEPAPATPAPDIGESTAPARASTLAMPASGSIIREYSRGRNDGIDIGAAAGSAVKAADAGTVAAITTDTDGVQIVVIRHEGDLLTVYTHVGDLTVTRGASVSRGQTIGKVAPGDPALLHFEVRRGMDSQDPAEFLPI